MATASPPRGSAPGAAAAAALPDATPPLAGVMLLSSAAMGYEVLLTRLFSIIQWHHFAYMMISVALLGYGAAGTFVALAQRRLLPRFERAFAVGAVSFGITAVAGFALAQRVAFNPLEILWDPQQPLRLLVIYGLLFVPFFCAASCICLTFTRFAGEPHRIYSFDILGAGAGSLGILAALYVLAPVDALKLLGGLGIGAASLGLVRGGTRDRWVAAVLLAAAITAATVIPADWLNLRASEYKELAQTLRIDGARIVAESSSPLGLVTVVENARVPLRHAPGMSLGATLEPPPQLAVFTDGDGLSALTRYDGRREPLAYLDQLTSALPFHLLERPRVLVLGAGAGADVLQAIYHRARSIDAVELNPQIVDLVQRQFADFSGAPYSAPGVRIHVGEARGFVAARGGRFDLIQVALLDAFGASSAGLYALSESYLYTVEALQEYLRHLEPGGMLAITRWVDLPPRDILKLVATAVVAVERGGGRPAEQLALIRGWRTATLIVKNGALTAADIAALREFCRARSFDIAYFPGVDAAETDRYNVLGRPDFHDGALALLGGDRETFIGRYKFSIAPATDDRPYFFHFFKWRTLPELLALKERGGLPLLEWGYPVLIATLVQAVAASVVLILLPLGVVARRTEESAAQAISAMRVAAYFLSIGFAFMFVEIAFIQKFLLLLAHPLYAVAVVLCSFLVFAGLGSRHSGRARLAAGNSPRRTLLSAVAAIGALSLLYLGLLPPLFRQLLPLPDALKILLSIALIAPLAFAMGMPFPLGLARTAGRAASLVPWAWGVNGCASVVAAILATMLAIHVGFAVVVVLAVLLYALAAAVFP
jgi:SAM-dependent methyltransferase